MFILLNTETAGMLYVYALVYGFGYGSMAPMIPILLSDRFGRDVLGSAFGLLVFFAVGIGGSLGPLLGGIIYDKTGSYGDAWRLNIILLIFISFLMFTLKPKQVHREVKSRKE
jgi:MFS family permease